MDTHHSLDQPLNHLEQEAIQFLMEYGEIRSYKIDEIIVREGEESSYVYILLKGMAHIIKDDAFNNSNIIAKAMPGAIIGEMGVFMELKRTASIVATTGVNALELSNERFMEGLENYPVLMNRLLKNMSSKLNFINQVMVREKQSRQMLFIGMLIMKQLGGNNQENTAMEMDFEEPIEAGTLSMLDLTNTFINYQKLHILDQIHFKEDNHICGFMVHPLSLQRFLDHGATGSGVSTI